MSTVIELEHEILTLPDRDFQTLLAWMEEQYLARLATDGFEAPELETAMLRGLEGKTVEWNDTVRERLRAGWVSGGIDSVQSGFTNL